MNLLKKLFNRNKDGNGLRTGGMEDFMTLIRVYFQASIASKVGITNLNMLPDLRVFKQTLKVPTINNRLGLNEKSRCRKMLGEIYGLKEDFFKEIDESVKKNCRNVNEMQSYLYMFQGFSQDLLTLLTNSMQVKLRIPAIFKKTLRSVVADGVNNIMEKDDWKDDSHRKLAVGLRQMQRRLLYSKEWMTEYAWKIVILAKKEPRKKDTDTK